MLKNHLLRGLYFSPDDAGGGTAGAAASGNDPAKNGEGGEEKKAFTQKELDALFADRAKSASSKATSDLLTALGVKDADEIKLALAEAKKLKDAQKSETEKALEREEAMKAQLATLTKERDEAKAQQHETELKNAVIAEAMKQNFADVNDAWLHVDRAAITEKDGKFENIAKLVETVAKAKPYLIKSQQSSGVGTPPPPRNSKQQPGAGTQPPASVRVSL